MKKILKIITFSIFSICLILMIPHLASAEVEGDYTYTVSTDGVTITQYNGPGGDVVIPDTLGGAPVISIGFRAFWGFHTLSSIGIPNSVTKIEMYAFSNTSLSTINISKYVTQIEVGAFANCEYLTSINVDPQNIVYLAVEGVLYNKSMTALMWCPPTKEGVFTIPNSVFVISGYAFSGCRNLTSIMIPNGVVDIGLYAFQNCINIRNITLPDGLQIIQEGTFAGSGISDLYIPKNVNQIGNISFYFCDNLSSINVSPENQMYSSLDGVLYDKYQTCLLSFPSAKGGLFTIPDSVTKIADGSFFNCSKITEVHVPKNVTSIGGKAFAGCINLSCIKLFGNAPSIGFYTFIRCSPNMSVYYVYGSTGYTNPWNDFSTQPMYALSYDGNGNTSGSVPKALEYFLDKESPFISGNEMGLEKTGYVFDGWNTKPDGTGTRYLPNDTITMGSDNVILYANWKKLSTAVEFTTGVQLTKQDTCFNVRINRSEIPETLANFSKISIAGIKQISKDYIATVIEDTETNLYGVEIYNDNLGTSSANSLTSFYNLVMLINSENIVLGYYIIPQEVSVSLDKSSLSLFPEGTYVLKASITPNDEAHQGVNWSIVSDTDIVTVSPTGLVSALKPGTAVVRATSLFDSTKHAECTVTVDPIAVTSIALKASTTIVEGQSEMLKSTIEPNNATDQDVTWSIISGKDIVSVSSIGLVTALKPGTAIVRVISIYDNSKYADCTVTVDPIPVVKVTEILVSGDNNTNELLMYGTMQMNAIVSPNDATNKSIDWSVVNGTGQATISASGVLTAIKAGIVTVVARSNDGSEIYGSINISIIVKPISSITIVSVNNKTTVQRNETLQLNALVQPTNATTKAVVWSVTNIKGRATISSSGLLTGTKAGTITVTATALDGSGIIGTMLITVAK